PNTRLFKRGLGHTPVAPGVQSSKRVSWRCATGLFSCVRWRGRRCGVEQDPVLARLIAWGKGRDDVRAMLITSTRAVPGGTVDALSDYDVIVVARAIEPLVADGG